MIVAPLRSAIEKIPTREERLGGQTFKYVKLSEVLDLLDAFHNTHEPDAGRCDFVGMYDVQCGLNAGHEGKHKILGPFSATSAKSAESHPCPNCGAVNIGPI